MVAAWERSLVFDTTPKSISPVIRDFCGNIRRDQQPLFLEIEPDPSAHPRECYFNVKMRCENLAGTLQHGWAIWLWPHVWLKAEHHAVWNSPEHKLIDITPQKSGLTRILFLPDNSRMHDPTGERRIMPIVRPLSREKLIIDAIDAERSVERYEEQHTVAGSREMKVNTLEYEYLGLAKTAALFRLLINHTRQTQTCPCQSGLKFRECHLPLCIGFLEKWDNESGMLKARLPAP